MKLLKTRQVNTERLGFYLVLLSFVILLICFIIQLITDRALLRDGSEALYELFVNGAPYADRYFGINSFHMRWAQGLFALLPEHFVSEGQYSLAVHSFNLSYFLVQIIVLSFCALICLRDKSHKLSLLFLLLIPLYVQSSIILTISGVDLGLYLIGLYILISDKNYGVCHFIALILLSILIITSHESAFVAFSSVLVVFILNKFLGRSNNIGWKEFTVLTVFFIASLILLYIFNSRHANYVASSDFSEKIFKNIKKLKFDILIIPALIYAYLKLKKINYTVFLLIISGFAYYIYKDPVIYYIENSYLRVVLTSLLAVIYFLWSVIISQKERVDYKILIISFIPLITIIANDIDVSFHLRKEVKNLTRFMEKKVGCTFHHMDYEYWSILRKTAARDMTPLMSTVLSAKKHNKLDRILLLSFPTDFKFQPVDLCFISQFTSGNMITNYRPGLHSWNYGSSPKSLEKLGIKYRSSLNEDELSDCQHFELVYFQQDAVEVLGKRRFLLVEGVGTVEQGMQNIIPIHFEETKKNINLKSGEKVWIDLDKYGRKIGLSQYTKT
jgi:hypothetical protein